MGSSDPYPILKCIKTHQCSELVSKNKDDDDDTATSKPKRTAAASIDERQKEAEKNDIIEVPNRVN